VEAMMMTMTMIAITSAVNVTTTMMKVTTTN
jgi:hypothetical protein